MLRSVDFDFDLIFSAATPHPQEFGKSVAASGRSLVAGAPYADCK